MVVKKKNIKLKFPHLCLPSALFSSLLPTHIPAVFNFLYMLSSQLSCIFKQYLSDHIAFLIQKVHLVFSLSIPQKSFHIGENMLLRTSIYIYF